MARSTATDLRVALAAISPPIPRYTIATVLGVHPTTFSGWCSGRVAFDPDVLTRLPAAITQARALRSRLVTP